MTLTDALLWIVGAFTLRDLIGSVRSFGPPQRGWLFVQGFVLALTLSAAWFGREELAYAACLSWLLFVFGPGFAGQRQYQLSMAYRFGDAARWGQLAGILHPFDGVRDQATYFLAQSAIHASDVPRARALFEKLRKSAAYRELAQVELWRLEREWTRIIAFIETKDERQKALAGPYLRALGESGEVARMLLAFAALPPILRLQPMVRLIVVAFAGETELVERLLAGPLATMNANGRDYWLGVAHQVSGEFGRAALHFHALRRRGTLSAQAELRLKTPLARIDLASLPAGAQAVLTELRRELEAARGVTATRRPGVATVGIAVVLVGFYLVRFIPGWEEPVGLVRLGALVLPPQITDDGVLWRLLCAGLLHANAAHLLMNVFGLWVLGAELERSWGSLALSGIVLGSSVGAYTIALLFMHASLEEPRYLLGASAGLMGLVGALATFSAVGYFGHGDRRAGQRLGMAGLMVVLQLAFDRFMPMVSSFLHIAGAACGAVLALPFSLSFFARRRRTSTA